MSSPDTASRGGGKERLSKGERRSQRGTYKAPLDTGTDGTDKPPISRGGGLVGPLCGGDPALWKPLPPFEAIIEAASGWESNDILPGGDSSGTQDLLQGALHKIRMIHRKVAESKKENKKRDQSSGLVQEANPRKSSHPSHSVSENLDSSPMGGAMDLFGSKSIHDHTGARGQGSILDHIVYSPLEGSNRSREQGTRLDASLYPPGTGSGTTGLLGTPVGGSTRESMIGAAVLGQEGDGILLGGRSSLLETGLDGREESEEPGSIRHTCLSA